METKVFGFDLPVQLTTKSNGDFNGEKYTHLLFGKGKFHDFMRWLRASPRPTSGSEHNKNEFSDQVYSGSNGFKGGSFEDLMEPLANFGNYNDALKKLSQQKVWKAAIQSFSEISTRRRTRCQYDGEFDFDKRWDSEPFQRRSPKTNLQRVVKIMVQAGFSSGVEAADIERYAGFVAAISNLLERNGVMVQLDVAFCTTGFAHDDKGSKTVSLMNLAIKRPDEYLPPGQILKALSAPFYRRAYFGMIIAGAEHLSMRVDCSLGYPYKFGKAWSIDGNKLTLFSAPSPSDQEKIIEQLMEIVGATTEQSKKEASQ